MAEAEDANADYLELTADVVSAFVSNNSISAGDLPGLIEKVHVAFRRLGEPGPQEEVIELKPAVPVKKSVTTDYVICLEDGLKFKSLRRHLRTKYNMTPEEYRKKWGLPLDYPMVAPSYAQERSNLAKQMGLGQVRRPQPPVAARGRKKAS